MTMYLLKKWFVKKYFYWFTYEEPYVPYKIMLERIVGSISSSNIMHEFADNNSNPYRSIVMDAMKMYRDYSSEDSRKHI
jgi:hypothetical protein